MICWWKWFADNDDNGGGEDDDGLSAPEAMIALVEEEKEVGVAGRRNVYARLYGAWRSSTGGGGRVVWPPAVMTAVRAIVKAGEGEGPSGLFDSDNQG
ncbi:hypothetical protein PoB_006553800 [Plakobranchus ocellatus]|uniref:Uncharacterized protein n=1 Tax=Plakobranchus ocellatus TaxID=259542 RepID=A0AAV4D4F2_9GAST|nr:hypothetical protein PoB_006553800 [Plakobranchus ocellatus]